jgi:hypothetical protein
MSLFQTTVVAKYLKSQHTLKLNEKWDIYKSHFLNPIIQENIRNSKEEQYQEGFLRDLFVKILGYTLNPENSFNLTTELKNVKDSKKADGGIIINDSVVGVVELKGTNTTDLGKVEEQAFGYKNNQPECVYVITSNFEKLRFYIDNAIEHIEFNLFTLTELEFKLLYLCLGFENVKNNIPKKLKEESLSQEELITKQLYKDYSLFKRELFQNLCELNPQFEPLELFKKSQKLLDRCLFLFFAEDRNLLPPNSVRLILDQWKKLQELDAYTPLYDRFKKYFGYLNTGFKGKQYDVFPYNGGLFKPDDVLDNITINDELLYKHSFKLSEYDFESEVDVNILGHIFENSLNELDEITAQLEGQVIDKSNTKRKKDGVFYTPKYITKYIVENTIGKLCDEKKAELDITDEAYQPAKQRSRKRLDNLNLYRNWLLQLTICDPACGSGAFLNQALDFLINEHIYIEELSAKYNKDAFVLSDVEKSILENNLFGVDLNEESVEIAKLSLWLRTAQPNRKLNDLSDNIKCGNSLIDDISVAGDKAFNWEKEFPKVFAKGGFDVIIGNPPYGAFLSKEEKLFFKSNYKVTEYNYDTYNFFFELSLKIMGANKYLGFITPNTFLVVENGMKLRKLLFQENTLLELFETLNVFEDAVVEPINIILKKSKPNQGNKIKVLIENRNSKDIKEEIFDTSYLLSKHNLILNFRESKQERLLFEKIVTKSNPLIDFAKVTTGIKPYQTGKGKPKQTKETLKIKPFTSFESKPNWNPLIRGTQVRRYQLLWDGEYIEYGEWLAEPRSPSIFYNPKLLIRRTDDNLMCVYDEDNFIAINSVHIIQLNEEKDSLYNLLAQINSKLCNWFFRHQNFHMVNKPMAEVKVIYVERLPIIDTLDKFLETSAKTLLKLNKDLFDFNQKFLRLLERKFEIRKFSKKLENWQDLSYSDFIKELQKKNIVLSLSEETDWEEFFLVEQKKILEIQNKITSTDKEIDAKVYELYGLSDEEIEIIENS